MQDSVSHQPVPYATVVLLPLSATGSQLAGATTDPQGLFTLPKVIPGSFRLQVSFVGYASRTQPVVVTSATTTLPLILLVPAAQQLGEAVVVGRKPLVEMQPDRLVYQAAQDIGNAGGTAADVLRKTPLLAVDGLGAVTMRGSTNFRVLVNNHPSPTLAQNLTQALKGLPADQIQRVEVITTPSARDDGEGTAGIINIVLKKGARRQLNGHIGASGGNRATELTSALGFKRGPVSVNAAASTGTWYEPDQLSRRRLGFSALGIDTLTQSGRRINSGQWYNATLSLDYDPAEHHRFALTGTLSGYQGQGQRDLFNRFASPDVALNQLFTRANTEYVGNSSHEVTGTYTRTFAQARREWSVLAQYARNAGTFGYAFDQFSNSAVALAPDRADYRERSQGQTPSQEVTAQTDFKQPFGEATTVDVGLKAIFRRTGAVATVEGLTPAQTPDFVSLANRGTDFSYAQDVQAAYASYATALGKKLAITLGSRVERTNFVADFRTSGTSLAPRSYVSVLPNASLNYTFRRDTTGLRLAYSRRITRPYIDYLNPFVDRSNPQNITYGNPDLAPELTDAYEVSYNTLVHAAPVIVSGTVRHTGNAIEAVRLPTTTSGVTAQTYANVAAVTYYQLTFYGTAKFTKQWEVSGGPNAQYVVFLSPDRELLRRGFSAGMNVDTSYHFRRTLTAQASLSGALPTPILQGQGGASLSYSMGVKKTLLGEKAEVTLNVLNPFTDSFPTRNSITTAFIDERTEYRSYQRGFRLSLNYRFGQDAPEREHRKANNDDLKSK
ncbi:TonB-dependent receptor (plasmid) [Hymenobacter sp. BRD128]|nr:TonB-dependent receptor [Hymenobacter sp. BRD128]